MFYSVANYRYEIVNHYNANLHWPLKSLIGSVAVMVIGMVAIVLAIVIAVVVAGSCGSSCGSR